MSAITLRAQPRVASGALHARKATVGQMLRHLAHYNPNQFSSYAGVKLLLPSVTVPLGRSTTVAQGSAAARKPVQMSFFGVGAPEALLVGVVALVVFGPKGLAEAARSVGGALRSFQPTIKEVVQVSQELKGTLEKELGIEELRDAARPAPLRSTELDSYKNATQVDDALAKGLDPEIEAKRAASAQMAWGGPGAAAGGVAAAAAPAAAAGSSGSGTAAPAPAPAPAAAPAAAAAPAPAAAAAPLKDLSAMSMEELEAELARRRAAGGGGK